jgi:hypothetical protein
VVKKDAEVARPNWFLDPKTNKLHRRKGGNRDVIVIDDDDAGIKKEIVHSEMEDVQEISASDMNQMDTKGL